MGCLVRKLEAARPSGPSAKWLRFANARPSRNDSAIERQSARVVPLRIAARLTALNDHRSTVRAKTVSEHSSPNNEKAPRKLREAMKRNAGSMAKASAMMRIVQPDDFHVCKYN